MRNILLVSAALLLLAGCGPRQQKATTAIEGGQVGETAGQSTEEQAAAPKEAPRPFPAVEMPVYVNTQEQMVEYMAEHYWDKFDFADTLFVETETLEKAYGEYSYILANYPDKEAARRGIASVMKRAENYPAMYNYLWDMAEKYFYDANSPVRDDEVYIGVLESVLANPVLDDLMKIAPREKLAIVKMNRPGTKANDFSFTTSTGSKGTLYGINAEYTMIFFYNLGCPACKAMRADILRYMEDPTFANLINSGKLKVLSMYPDSNLEEWKKYLADIPSNWINAYDSSSDNSIGRLYDLKAIPSLYLLDKNKNVILKDFTEPAQLYQLTVAN
jgi:thiol-disulfide isomerase/thioredoxin/uncharacterized protein YceK